MRAAVIRSHGDLDEVGIAEVPRPEPGPGQVRVDLRAAALNHLDLFVVGGLPGIDLEMPHVLGSDGAGVVAAVGGDVEAVAPGDEVVLNPGLWCGECEFCERGEESMCVRYRLLGEHVDGTFAGSVVVPADNCHPKPAGLSWAEAAAFPLVTLTAWRMMVTRGGVGTDDTVLIHGIGGGVSLACLLLGRRSGARIFVTSHSEDKRSRALELGAEEAIDYTSEDVAERVRELTGKRGVDLVIDNVGQATFDDSIAACRKGGRIVTCGATTGPRATIDVRRVFWNQIEILGSTMGSQAEFRAMRGAVEAGEIEPVVDRVYPLDRVGDALRRMKEADQFGKIVLRISDAG